MIPVIIWLCLQGSKLDNLMIGDYAAQLVNVPKLRWRLIFAVSILVGCAVALGGVIALLALVVPYTCCV